MLLAAIPSSHTMRYEPETPLDDDPQVLKSVHAARQGFNRGSL